MTGIAPPSSMAPNARIAPPLLHWCMCIYQSITLPPKALPLRPSWLYHAQLLLRVNIFSESCSSVVKVWPLPVTVNDCAISDSIGISVLIRSMSITVILTLEQ